MKAQKTLRRAEKRRARAHFERYRDTYLAVIADKDAEIERLQRELDFANECRATGKAAGEKLHAQIERQAETIERMGREHDRMVGERDRFLDQKYTAVAERDAAHERIRQLDAINAELRAGLDTSKAEPVARLTQDLAAARRETADALHDRDQAQAEAAENMALADRRKEMLTRQAAELKESKASQGRAWAECERLKGIICRLDRRTVAVDADSRLGRLIRAMPFWNLCRHAENSWTVRCLMYGEVNVAFYHSPEEALSAAGVVDPLASGGEGCEEEDREMEGTT